MRLILSARYILSVSDGVDMLHRSEQCEGTKVQNVDDETADALLAIGVAQCPRCFPKIEP